MNWNNSCLKELEVIGTEYATNHYSDNETPAFNIELSEENATFSNLPKIETVTFSYECTKID
jgi:hypothetical protein